ncbi:MAG: MopE-related protein [bacterium]
MRSLAGAQAQELCNGLDEDCSGTTDEDAVGDSGQACGAGIGACQQAGVRRCAGGVLTCDAVPGAPEVEACNGADDDCDGLTDEDVPVEPCFAGVGACREAGARQAGGLVCRAWPAQAGLQRPGRRLRRPAR